MKNKLKYVIVCFGWCLTFLIPLNYINNDIVVSIEGCTNGNSSSFLGTTILSMIIFFLSLFCIIPFKINSNKLYYIGFFHIFSFVLMVKYLSKYLVYTTIKGISPCIVIDNVNSINRLDITNYKEWQDYFTDIDRLYAPLGFIIVLALLIISFIGYRKSKLVQDSIIKNK